MPEPSVLDYVKALLSFRRTPVIPALPKSRAGKPAAQRASVTKSTVRRAPQITLPWRGILAFTLFVAAQLAWSSQPPAILNGALLALAAVAMAIWAVVKREWRLPQTEQAQEERKTLHFRQIPLFIGLIFFALTFAFSGGNRFTSFNVSLWVLSIIFVLAAFWQSSTSPTAARKRLRASWQAGVWSLRLSRWILTLLAAFAVIAIFRFAQLETAPMEMLSDHAEKLLDVNEILNGQTSIFFERNTGREPMQFYLTAAISQVFGTGLSFLSLKLGTTVLAFVSLIYIYLLGKELGGRWVGLFALLLVGFAFWPNLLARTGLRFSLYPTFAAPMLFYLIYGLRRGKLNSLLLAGIFLGIGLNGYTAFRIMPLVAAAAVLIFWLHERKADLRRRGLIGFALMALVTLVICAPLLRYAVEYPAQFGERVATRMFEGERAYSEPVILTLVKNIGTSLTMFNVDGGDIWLVGLPKQPAFDPLAGGLLILGVVLAIVRYVRRRSWLDLFLIISIPLMLLPSSLSLAFPEENPAMNRASGAWVPAFLLCALALDALLHGIKDKLGGRVGLVGAKAMGAMILVALALLNSDLFFNQYVDRYDDSAWNSSEMGKVIADYASSFGSYDSAWVVAYPHWVDTRLVGINAGLVDRDYGIWPDQLSNTLMTAPPKLFLLRPIDEEGLNVLTQLYPNGLVTIHPSRVEGKEFLTYFVPAQ
jgi:hypothetical protein